MNFKKFLIGIICLTVINARADTLEKMKQLPEQIVVDTADDTLNFQKGTRPDSFFTIEDAKLGNGYRQTYHNDICFASITQEPANVGRMSNVKVKRYLKDISQFQVTAQDDYKSGATSFFMNVGATPEQTSVLMLSGKDTSFLKIHVTCQVLPQLSESINRKSTVAWAKKIADAAVSVLNETKKEK